MNELRRIQFECFTAPEYTQIIGAVLPQIFRLLINFDFGKYGMHCMKINLILYNMIAFEVKILEKIKY